MEDILNYTFSLESLKATMFSTPLGIAGTIAIGYIVGLLTIGRLMAYFEAKGMQRQNKINNSGCVRYSLDSNGLTNDNHSDLTFTVFCYPLRLLYLFYAGLFDAIGSSCNWVSRKCVNSVVSKPKDFDEWQF